MHETSIVKNLIEEANKHGEVKSITVEVGQLAHVPAYEIKDLLSALVDWEINVSTKRATVNCICGFYGEPKILEKLHGHTLFVCPSCGNTPNILDGEEITLKKVELK